MTRRDVENHRIRKRKKSVWFNDMKSNFDCLQETFPDLPKSKILDMHLRFILTFMPGATDAD